MSFIFFQVWHLTLFWYFFCRQKPCHLPTKMFSMILQKGPPQAPRLSIWIVAQRTLLPPFESNLKTRHYEYALDFYGHFFYSFMCLNIFIFMYYPFSEKTTCFVWKAIIVYTNYNSILFFSLFLMFLFAFYFMCLFFIFFLFFLFFFLFLFYCFYFFYFIFCFLFIYFYFFLFYCFLFICVLFLFFIFLIFLIFFVFSLFPRKFLKFKGWPWI